MTSDEYAKFRDSFLKTTTDMSDLKRIEYTIGNQDNDVFTNFRSIGDRLGLDPKLVLAIYLFKHIDSIRSFLKHGKTFTEEISGRISDAINYLVLLNGLIESEKKDDSVGESWVSTTSITNGK